MDIVDRAQALEEVQRQDALRELARVTEYCESQLYAGATVVCRECLEPIQIERLRINPRAVRCIDCQIEEDRYDQSTARRFAP